MKKSRYGLLARFMAAAIAAMLLAGTFSVTNAEAAVGTPGNCRFVSWGTSFTNCYISWNQVSGADGYQTVWSWTDGSHAKYSYHASNSYGVYVSNAPNNHVSMVKVRAFRWVKGKRSYGPWSNIAFITPSPSSISGSIVSSTASSPKERLRWNVIYGSDGYNVFLTTNPRASWRWNQSTAAKATANTAVISKYAGGKLKTYTNYYFRLVTRRKRNGVFCTVPMPSSTYFSGYFWFYRY